MKNHVLIAPVGEDMESIYQLVRTFPTDKVFLISDGQDMEKAKAFGLSLEKFRIPAEVAQVKQYTIDELSKVTKNIMESEKERDVIISVASGNKVTSCLTLSAAFVNGIKAVGIVDGKVMLMPVLRFSYYKAISDQKLRMLKFLYSSPQCCRSLEELSKQMKMSLPLVSYHINGNRKVEGLRQMGLVEATEGRKRISIRLSELGRMMMSGYI
jgi:hypothetical protein